MADTTIEWTDTTWNPTTGCDRISPGCDNCYALTMAKRLKGMGSAKYQTDGDPRTSGPGFGVATHEDTLNDPFTWKKPRKVFVNSMSDLFHARVPVEFIRRVFEVIEATPQHTYQVLTKRASRLPKVADQLPWPRNLWMGVSVENQEEADRRIPALLSTPAAVRWISAEPLLGPVRLSAAWIPMPADAREVTVADLLGVALPNRLDWVVTGGESGPGARPMHPDWACALRDQCVAAGVAFHFKQWGEWVPESMWLHRNTAPAAFLSAGGTTRPLVNGKPTTTPMSRGKDITIRRVGKKAAGRELDGRTWDEFPAEIPVPA